MFATDTLLTSSTIRTPLLILKFTGSTSQMNASLADLKSQLNLPDSVAHSVSDVRAAFAACASGVTFPFISMRGNTS
ncbi:hypothetical protein PC120_g19135 [Phytophthora cactorum]|nr:hypothetical protein PC120_g19135 [Phytophthora cactorum]